MRVSTINVSSYSFFNRQFSWQSVAVLLAISLTGCQGSSSPSEFSSTQPIAAVDGIEGTGTLSDGSPNAVADAQVTDVSDTVGFANIDPDVASKTLTTTISLPANVQQIAIATPTGIKPRVIESQDSQITAKFLVVGDSQDQLTPVTDQNLSSRTEGNQLTIQATPPERCNGLSLFEEQLHSFNGVCLVGAEVTIPSNSPLNIYTIDTDWSNPEQELVWLATVPKSAADLVIALPQFNDFAPKYEHLTLIQRFSEQRTDVPVSYADYLAILRAVIFTLDLATVTEILAPQIKQTEGPINEADINLLVEQNSTLLRPFEEELRKTLLDTP
ncbi:hypothetical protein [Leptothoe spongobia]|uniref:Lipoprotein n=1 Tax=Leptothoe spongobia TAU-MAC 1115 TaxID=1967444 RepID=A0A947DH35_9CYAN|nr:hypothetical protein [Leptothoe spongobia]MBT9316488.1 hypothetical protein [Leptothoe spongobia TAU-MAC 1115]